MCGDDENCTETLEDDDLIHICVFVHAELYDINMLIHGFIRI